MKIKTSRNLHWKEICLVGMIILNSITVITIYDTNILGFTNTNTILHPSAKDSSAAPVNTNMIQGHKGTTHTTKSNNADTNAKTIASNTENNIIAGPTTQTSTIQTTSSLSQTQTSNGVSQANVLVNDTTETLNNTFLNLKNGYNNQINNNASSTLVTIPTNYVNTSGTFNITNLNAGLESVYICGNTTSPTGTTFSSSLTNIATSFTVTQTKINITRLRFYYTSGGNIPTKYVYFFISGVTSSKPNSTVYGNKLTQAISQTTTGVPTFIDISYGATPVTLFKGTYSAVIMSSTSKFSLFSQPDSITGNKSQMWTYNSSAGWSNVSSDLIFGYTYILVSNNNQTLNYISPLQVNLNYNGTALTNLTNRPLLLNGSKMYFTADIAVTFNLSYIIYYQYISNPIKVQIIYNSINATYTIWNVTITDKQISFPTTGTGNYTIINHTLLLYNLSSNWNSTLIFRNSKLFVTNIDTNSSITYTNGSSTLLLNINSITASYNWTFSFISSNYIQSLILVQKGQNFDKTLKLPYELNSSDILNTTAYTSPNSYTLGSNGSLLIYNSAGILVYKKVNASISSNQITFGSWNISQSLNLNSDVNGSYSLNVLWVNTNQTEVGFMSVTFTLFMQTDPLQAFTNASSLFVQGETIGLTANYLSAYNGTILNLANITYLASWNASSGILTQSFSHNSYTTSISTANIPQGSYYITLFASLGGYVNRSISLPIQIVVKLQTSPIQKNIISGLSKLGYTQTINLLWNISIPNNQSLITNPTYSIMLNTTLITNYHAYGMFLMNSTRGSSYSLQLQLDFDPVLYNFSRGLYNYTLSFSNRFLIGQTVSLPIFVHGYNVNVTLEYNRQLFRTNSFPITAILTYTNSSQSGSTSTLASDLVGSQFFSSNRFNIFSTYTQSQIPLLGSPVVGMNVLFTVGVLLNNGTSTVFSTSLTTDSHGTAIYIIPQSETALINSFSYINVSIAQNTYNDAYTYHDTSVKTGITVQNTSSSGLLVDILLLGFLGLLLVVLSYSVYVFVQKRQITISGQQKRSYEQLKLLSNIYAILVTTSSGLPILIVVRKGLSGDTEIASLISGLSVGMDSFLQNFQQDFFNHLNHDTQTTDHRDQTTEEGTTQPASFHTNISTVDRETFKILIASSPNFRIFVFLKEKTFAGTDNLFRSIITNLENNIVLDDIIDDNVITPQVEAIINTAFPLTLLRTFTVDMQKFMRLLAESQVDPQASISLEALNALKSMLIIRSGQLSPEDRSIEKARKVFDELRLVGHLPATGEFRFEEVLELLEEQLKLSPKLILELLWKGALYNTRLFVPASVPASVPVSP